MITQHDIDWTERAIILRVKLVFSVDLCVVLCVHYNMILREDSSQNYTLSQTIKNKQKKFKNKLQFLLNWMDLKKLQKNENRQPPKSIN